MQDGDADTLIVAAGGTLRRTMAVGLPPGLHARPGARIAKTAREAGVTATLTVADREAPCDSSMAMLVLGVSHGADVTIAVTGAKAAAALDAITTLLTREVDAPPSVAFLTTAPNDIPNGSLAGITAASALAIGTADWLRRSRPEIPVDTDDMVTEKRRLMS